MSKINIKSAMTDFTWVIKVLESSENGFHMEASLKCFYFWVSKYKDPDFTNTEEGILRGLKSDFWALFKNKNITIGTTNL